MVTTINSTIIPTEKATSPLAIWASFGMNGAPAIVPSRIKAVPAGVSSGRSRSRSTARAGTATKLPSSTPPSKRPLRRGVTTCASVTLMPTESMLVTTKARMPT